MIGSVFVLLAQIDEVSLGVNETEQYMFIYGYVWACIGMYGYIWVCIGLFGYIWVDVSM